MPMQNGCTILKGSGPNSTGDGPPKSTLLPSNSQTPAECLRLQLTSGTTYMKIASETIICAQEPATDWKFPQLPP